MTRSAPEAPPLWAHRPFLAFWASQAFSELGAQLGDIALPVLAVAVLGATSWQLGVLNALDTAAFLVIGLPAGAWLDRLRKRRVMLVADLGRGLLLASVPVAWLAHLLTIGQLFVVGGLLSVGTVFFDVGYQSFVPFLVPRERIADANGRLEATAQVARVAGPGLGGLLLAVVSPPLLLVTPVITYLGSSAVLTRVRDTELPVAGRPEPLVAAIRAGLGFVVRPPLISRITAATGTSNLFGTIVATLLPLLVLRDLALGAPVLGAVVSVGALGGILGAVGAAPLDRRLGEGRLLPVALGTAAAAAPLVPLARPSRCARRTCWGG